MSNVAEPRLITPSQTLRSWPGPQARRWLRAALSYLLASAGAVLFLLPLFWMISSSLKPNYQVLEFPPRWLPNPIQWSNSMSGGSAERA